MLKLCHENDVNNCNDESDSNDENILINNVLFLPITDYDKPIDVKKTCTDSTCDPKIKEVLAKYPSLHSDDVSVTNVLSCSINLANNCEPVKKLPYAVPLSYRTKLNETLDKMLTEPN